MFCIQRHGISLAMAMLAIVATAGQAARGQGFGRLAGALRPAPGPNVEEPAAADDDEPRSIVLPDNGELRELDAVRRQIESGHDADAARQLGQFLQDPEVHDFFLSRGEERRGGSSFLAEVRRLLHALPPEGHAAYRVQFEATARARLNAAVAQGDEAALRAVAARFPETRAGDEALYRLGQYLWDHGRAREAAACLERLLSRPAAAAPFEPGLSLLAGACWGRTGNSEKARAAIARLHKTLPLATPHIAGSLTAGPFTDAGLSAFLLRIGRERSPSDGEPGNWSTFRGDAARNRSVAARAPFLAPRWSYPASANPQTQLTIDRAWQSYASGVGTSLPLLSPLAVGDLVLARSARGVAAFDLETGRCRWRQPSDDDDDNSGLERVLWQEPAGGGFSADDECVYLIDDVRLDGVNAGGADGGGSGQNTLSAREHFRSREGNLRWQVGGSDGGAEPRLNGAFFLGPPLVWQAGLYLLVERHGALALAVLDRATGRLQWSQDLAVVERGITADLVRLVGGATPSISTAEIIVCPTSGGAVVALDSTSQSLLWAYRYKCQSPRQPTDADDEPENAPRLDQFDRWLDATVTIAGDCVILTPAESREIHCLDLKTGEPRWSKPRGDGMFVACATGETAVIVGRRQVVSLSLSDGAAVWSRPLPEKGFPAGRGVYAGTRYFLPITSAAVLELDLATGKVVEEHKSPRELSAGNLIWHRGLFVSQGAAALEVFDERDSLTTLVRERLDRDPQDPAALVRKGELELGAGRFGEAITAFRAAHDAARSPRTRAKLISALLEGVRQKLPDSDKLSAELDLLIGP